MKPPRTNPDTAPVPPSSTDPTESEDMNRFQNRPKSNSAAKVRDALIDSVVDRGVGFILGFLTPMVAGMLTGWVEAFDVLPF